MPPRNKPSPARRRHRLPLRRPCRNLRYCSACPLAAAVLIDNRVTDEAVTGALIMVFGARSGGALGRDQLVPHRFGDHYCEASG